MTRSSVTCLVCVFWARISRRKAEMPQCTFWALQVPRPFGRYCPWRKGGACAWRLGLRRVKFNFLDLGHNIRSLFQMVSIAVRSSGSLYNSVPLQIDSTK